MSCKVGVAIVNYKTAPLVVECLAALAGAGKEGAAISVCVVDNASPDDSLSVLNQAVAEHNWSAWVDVIAAPKNGGFAYGNNVAFDHLASLHCSHYWLLNPDTLPGPDSLQVLLDYLAAHPEVGCVGSQLTDDDGSGQLSAFNFPRPLGEFVAASSIGLLIRLLPKLVVASHTMNQRGSVEWVVGASMLMRAEVVNRVGHMDEKYFLYYEEVDYCRKIHQAGFDVHFVPESRVVHHVGAATGISDLRRKQPPRRPSYWFESRRRFFRKNYGLFGAIVADVCWVLGFSCYRLKSLITGNGFPMPPKFFTDFLSHSVLNPLSYGNA
ncbi:glycosyltransferase family 2 protein [Halioxenophilus aromaticivorans]|uniref:Glycosyltransferase family 2 protein n=1 Tax=Halioxenophilus aromaticivorans TaxID=1306992 RepID=A0AAV3U0J9_9ALTE